MLDSPVLVLIWYESSALSPGSRHENVMVSPSVAACTSLTVGMSVLVARMSTSAAMVPRASTSTAAATRAHAKARTPLGVAAAGTLVLLPVSRTIVPTAL